jgi:ParB/RepB/Spo0J family partition protein
MKRASVATKDTKKMAGADFLDRILEQQVPSGGTPLQQLDLHKIKPDPEQPRKTIDDGKLQELAESIKEVGVLQPITVSRNEDDTYNIVMGERRWRAAQIAGMERIPALVVERLASNQKLPRQIIENIHREDLNDIDRAQALDTLKVYLGTPWSQVAQHVGLSEGRVHQLRRLKQLSFFIQDEIKAGRMTEKESRPFHGLTEEEQEELHRLCQSEHLTEQEVRQIASKLKKDVTGYSMSDLLHGLRNTEVRTKRQSTLPFRRLAKVIEAVDRQWQQLDVEQEDRIKLLELIEDLGQRVDAMRAKLKS